MVRIMCRTSGAFHFRAVEENFMNETVVPVSIPKQLFRFLQSQETASLCLRKNKKCSIVSI